MKLDKKGTEVTGGIGEKSFKANISQEQLHKLWDMLQNPYKDSISSIVREITSNCFDSHREANVDDAVIVKYSRDDSGFYVSFIDVGVGLSEERMENIYVNYLTSTKESSNEYIGAFGIGSKSPLSYQDMFYINTRYNGIEYNYMMRKGNESPELDFISSKITKERNGTEIKLYIKNENDLLKFLSASYVQLHYFKNVVFDLEAIKLYYSGYQYGTADYIVKKVAELEKDFKFYVGKSFIYRENTDITNFLHICIGDVYYPINWSVLGREMINIPIALKFNIGDLQVIQTREDIRYTDETVKKLNDKIDEFTNEIADKVNNTIKEFSFEDFMGHDFSNITITLGENVIQIPAIISKNIKINAPVVKDFPVQFKNYEEASTIKNIISSLAVSSHKTKFISSFEMIKEFNSNNSLVNLTSYNRNRFGVLAQPHKNYRCNNLGSLIDFAVSFNSVTDKGHPFYYTKDQTFSNKKNKYILYEKKQEDAIFVRFDQDRLTGYLKRPILLRKLAKSFDSFFSKKDSLKIIMFIQKFIYDKITNVMIDYDNLKVPDSWWKKYQAENKKTADYDRTKIAFQVFGNNGVWNRTDYRYTTKEFHDSFLKSKKVVILLSRSEQNEYCSTAHESDSILEKIVQSYNNLYSKSMGNFRLELVSLADTKYKKFLDNRNETRVFTLEEFLNNEKMQKSVLGKLATILKLKNQNTLLKIKYDFDVLMQNYYSGGSAVIKVLWNDRVNQIYDNLNEYLKLSLSLSNVGQIEEFVSEFDELDIKENIYDIDLLNNFNKIVLECRNSYIYLASNTLAGLLYTIKTHKPSSSQFMLDPVFLSDPTEDSIIEYYQKEFRGVVPYPVDDKEYYIKNTVKPAISYEYNAKNLTNNINTSYGLSKTEINKWRLLILIYLYEEKRGKFTVSEQDLIITKKIKEVETDSVEEETEEKVQILND